MEVVNGGEGDMMKGLQDDQDDQISSRLALHLIHPFVKTILLIKMLPIIANIPL